LTGADFETGRVVHWGYVGTPPRTLAYLCAHELTHVIIAEHARTLFRAPMGMGRPT
jgi:predicted metal-dependent hydrolase